MSADDGDDKAKDDEEEPTVHDQAGAMLALITINGQTTFRNAFKTMLAGKYIAFWKAGNPSKKFRISRVLNKNGVIDRSNYDRVGSINDSGDAYSSMEQADLMRIGLKAWQTWGGEEYRYFAIAAGRVLLDKRDGGGLRVGWWFTAQTSRTQNDIGWTLNKAMVAIRELHLNGEALGVKAFSEAAMHSAEYMVLDRNRTEQAPNIFDYVPQKANGNAIFNSWLFYGRGGGDSYFLSDKPYKNGTYHLYVMRLIHTLVHILPRFPMQKWKKKKIDGDYSILFFLSRAYENKYADGLFVDSATQDGGNFAALNAALTDPLSAQVRNWFIANQW